MKCRLGLVLSDRSGYLVSGGSLASKRKERKESGLHLPLVSQGWSEWWVESSQGDCTAGLLPCGSKQQEREKLGFPVCVIYLAGKHGGEGDTWGDFGFVRLCVIHWRWLEGGCACRVQSSGDIDV